MLVALNVTLVSLLVSDIVAVTVELSTSKFSKFPPLTLTILLSNVEASLYTSSTLALATFSVPVVPSVIVISPRAVVTTTAGSPAITAEPNVAVKVTVPDASSVLVALNVTLVSLLVSDIVTIAESLTFTLSKFPPVVLSTVNSKPDSSSYTSSSLLISNSDERTKSPGL